MYAARTGNNGDFLRLLYAGSIQRALHEIGSNPISFMSDGCRVGFIATTTRQLASYGDYFQILRLTAGGQGKKNLTVREAIDVEGTT